MKLWQRFWKWATVDWRSWIAHGLITLSVAVVMGFTLKGPTHLWFLALLFGMMCFYLHREVFKDRAKYIKAGTWADHKADGVGDAIAPVSLFVGALLMWLLMRG